MNRSISPWARSPALASLGAALVMLPSAQAQPVRAAVPGMSAPSAPATSASSAPSTAASAKPASTAKPVKPAKLDVDEIAHDLAHPDTLAAGLAAVTSAGPAAKKLAPRVEELLSNGLPPEPAALALAAIGAIGAAGSTPVIAPYVNHRSAPVRRAAAEALARTGGPGAASALRAALRSTDPALRSVAASGLGAVGDADSVTDLLRALDLGVIEAAPSIAALCAAPRCDELLERWDKLPGDARTSAVAALLRRKPPLPDAVLLRVVEKTRLAEGASAKALFLTLKASFKGSPRVRAALESASKGGKP